MENNRKNRVFYIFLSLLVAAAVWFFVDEYGNNGSAYLHEKTITDIPVEYKAEDKLTDRGLMLLEEGTTSTVDITVQGGRRLLARLDRSKITVSVDLSTVGFSGMQTLSYKVSYADNRFNDVIRKSISPALASVNISELNSKIVEVRCELAGNVAEGYSAGQLQLSHETVEIRGLEENIKDVSYAKVTLDYGKDAVETVSQALTCQFYDKNGRLLDSSGIHPTVETIQATLPIYVTKELRLAVKFVEYDGLRSRNLNLNIDPSTILVSGEAGHLKGIETITLGEIDLMELLQSGSSSTYYYPISIPDGCQNLSGVTRATVTVDFKDMVTARVPAAEITATNLPTGKHVEVLTTDLMIHVYGTAADVATITEENVFVTADLSEYTGASGTYTVPAEVTIIGAGDVGIRGEYEVKVNIQEPEPEIPPEEEE